MFKGFKIQYPSYTVICPQTGYTYDVRSLNVSEVNKLKTSLTVPAKASSLINKILWDGLQSKPDFIKTFDDFKKCTTLRDREALMYGLYYSTFGDEREFNVTCRSCSHSRILKVLISRMFSINVYPGSDTVKQSYKIAKSSGDAPFDPEIERMLLKDERRENPEFPSEMPKELADLERSQSKQFDQEDENDGISLGENKVKTIQRDKPKEESEENKLETNLEQDSILIKRVNIELPVSKIVAIIKQPTVWDEEQVMRTVSFVQKKQTDLINETLVIDRFEQYELGAVRPNLIVSDREDIVYGYQQLPSKDKIKIFEEFQKNFGDYGIELKTTYNCDECGIENELEVDIVLQFFRVVAGS